MHLVNAQASPYAEYLARCLNPKKPAVKLVFNIQRHAKADYAIALNIASRISLSVPTPGMCAYLGALSLVSAL